MRTKFGVASSAQCMPANWANGTAQESLRGSAKVAWTSILPLEDTFGIMPGN